jgi:hypothetical protein
MKRTLLLIFWQCCSVLAFTPQDVSPPAVPSEPQSITVPAGRAIAIRTVDAIDSKTVDPNQEYAASLDDPIVIDGVTLAPAGAHAYLKVTHVTHPKLKKAAIAISLSAVMISEQKVKVNAEYKESRGAPGGKGAVKGVAIGGLYGATLGRIFGLFGAGLGAAAGATAGAAIAVLTGEDNSIVIPPETRFTYKLTDPVALNRQPTAVSCAFLVAPVPPIPPPPPPAEGALAPILLPPAHTDDPAPPPQTSAVSQIPQCQPAPKAPVTSFREPELIGVVYFQDESGKLHSLERTSGVRRIDWQVEGARSMVRLKNGQKQLFIVRLANGIDPSIIVLYPFEPDLKKNSRRQKPDPKNRSSVITMRLNVTKVGESTYGLSPIGELSSGEYCFSSRNSNEAYCFGIDTGWADPK